ncbi:MAG: M61 family metallopeptidase [Nitrososphaerales archaeon]
MTVKYTVATEPQTHYFRVEMTLDLSNQNVLRLVMPVWTPGSYLVREFARNVLQLRAIELESNTELPVNKDTKNSWLVHIRKETKKLKIEYRVYAFEFTVDTSYLDHRHGIINGASVFLYAEGYENQTHILAIKPYSKWKVVATSLERISSSDLTFAAPSYDILIDSPIEIGNQEMYSFAVQGINHEVSIFGPKPIESENFVSDLKKIVEAESKVFDSIPYKRYLFLVDFTGNSTAGGLEHLSSTHCIAPRLRLIPSQEYHFMMSLFSHELFHAWNVKRMRPKGLGPFNYSSETYTKSLWIAEGITSYYDDLILRRAGIYSVEEYLDAFSLNVNQLLSIPSSRFESAEESSFDTWIKHYRPNENSPNVHPSYYFQGSANGWMIDMEIRKQTKNNKTLDDAMRKLYKTTFEKENMGYTDEEFESICIELGGEQVESIFENHVRHASSIDFDHYLGYAGLKLGSKGKHQSKGYLGIKTRVEGGKTVIATKLFSTPAEKCGLAVGDEIIGIDNLRLEPSTFSFYIANKKPGDKVSILISRDGILETLNAEIGEVPLLEHRIYKKDSANESEKQTFKSWMLDNWDNQLVFPDYTQSPHRPRPFEYI